MVKCDEETKDGNRGRAGQRISRAHSWKLVQTRMEKLYEDEPLAVAVMDAIHTGDVQGLGQLLAEHPELATASIHARSTSNQRQVTRTLLHIATDWPGFYPNREDTVHALIKAGAEVNARCTGAHAETPLHWAASNDDVVLLDILLDAGADIESPGAVIAGGTPLDDAVAFGQWSAAHRLVARGANIAVWHAAALGLMSAIQAHFAGAPLSRRYPWGASADSPPDDNTVAFWCACHGGQFEAAVHLLEQGAELNWVSAWDRLTPMDAAKRNGNADELLQWLRRQGAKCAHELT